MLIIDWSIKCDVMLDKRISKHQSCTICLIFMVAKFHDGIKGYLQVC